MESTAQGRSWRPLNSEFYLARWRPVPNPGGAGERGSGGGGEGEGGCGGRALFNGGFNVDEMTYTWKLTEAGRCLHMRARRWP